MSTYKQISKSEFDECLQQAPAEFEPVNYEWTKELVYEAYSKDNTFTIRIYSSIDKRTGKAREKGSDAIRLVVLHTDSGKPIAKEKRTNRIETYCKNLLEKIGNVVNNASMTTNCDECGRIMVIRKNKSNGNKFLGCTGYPQCKNTKSIE